MIDVPQTLRRMTAVVIAVALAGVLLHAQIASALVTRGDDLTYRGDAVRARLMYERSLLFSPGDPIAEDRLVFSELMTHRRSAIEDALERSALFLKADAASDEVRQDRALGLQMLKRYASAAQEFAVVGMRRHDARALTFAGIDALHAGETARARRWLDEALRYDPADLAARRARNRVTR